MAGKVNMWLAITVAVLLGILVGMMINGREVVAATGSSSPATAGYITALAGHVNANDQPIYIIDSREQVLLVYEYGLGQNGIKFIASRTFEYDKLLDLFDIQAERGKSPTPDEVRNAARKKKKRR